MHNFESFQVETSSRKVLKELTDDLNARIRL